MNSSAFITALQFQNFLHKYSPPSRSGPEPNGNPNTETLYFTSRTAPPSLSLSLASGSISTSEAASLSGGGEGVSACSWRVSSLPSRPHSLSRHLTKPKISKKRGASSRANKTFLAEGPTTPTQFPKTRVGKSDISHGPSLPRSHVYIILPGRSRRARRLTMMLTPGRL